MLVLALILALSVLGGLPGLLAHLPEARVQSLDLQHTGLGDGVDYAFWPMLFGGFFLYVSYYGCDQSQAQRWGHLARPGWPGKRRGSFLGGGYAGGRACAQKR